jgi:hypothetical protein
LFGRAVQNFALNSNEPVKGVQSEALFGRAKFRTPTNPSKEFKAKLCLAVQSFALNSNEPVKGQRSSKRSFVRPCKISHSNEPVKGQRSSKRSFVRPCKISHSNEPVKGVQSEALFGRAKLRFELQRTRQNRLCRKE